MDLKKFNETLNSSSPYHHLLAQDITEWQMFVEFIETYFKNRNISNPVVVEIGLMHNAQKIFYQNLLNAEHIGIDINPNCNPDILGDSHDSGTLTKLAGLLLGREIDLLFIDANHSYKSVKRDYELFAPLTRHIIAVHDIFATVKSEVLRFWNEISRENEYMKMTFIKHNSTVSVEDNKFIDMGIGLIIKGGN